MAINIYGVDPEKEVAPIAVRDAIIECFYKAHCADSEVGSQDKETSHTYCKDIIKKGFEDTGGDFEKPTKESIQKLLNNLVEFSKNFRDQKTVQKHFQEIMQLYKKL